VPRCRARQGLGSGRNPITAFRPTNPMPRFYDGCAAERRLRQRLQKPCSPVAAAEQREAAIGRAAAARSTTAFRPENHMPRVYDGCAAARRLQDHQIYPALTSAFSCLPYT